RYQIARATGARGIIAETDWAAVRRRSDSGRVRLFERLGRALSRRSRVLVGVSARQTPQVRSDMGGTVDCVVASPVSHLVVLRSNEVSEKRDQLLQCARDNTYQFVSLLSGERST